MTYSNESKPAKILNLTPLNELGSSISLKIENDTACYSSKKPENNITRRVFTLETADTNVKPTVRMVNCISGRNKYPGYLSFVVEPREHCTGIAVILLKPDEDKNIYYNVRMLPLNTLKDVADTEVDAKLLTVNLEKANYVLKTDITINLPGEDEAMYQVHDVDVHSISDILSNIELVELKRELEFQGSKLMANYCCEIVDILMKDRSNTNSSYSFPEDYILRLPPPQLKEVLLANAFAGNISIEIIGANCIRDLNRDWTAAAAFIGYMI